MCLKKVLLHFCLHKIFLQIKFLKDESSCAQPITGSRDITLAWFRIPLFILLLLILTFVLKYDTLQALFFYYFSLNVLNILHFPQICQAGRDSLSRSKGECALHWSLCPNMCNVEYELKENFILNF